MRDFFKKRKNNCSLNILNPRFSLWSQTSGCHYTFWKFLNMLNNVHCKVISISLFYSNIECIGLNLPGTNKTFSPYKHQINISLCLHLPHMVYVRLAIFLALSHYSDCATISATHHEAFKILSGCNARRLAACRTCGLQSLAMIIQHTPVLTLIFRERRHCKTYKEMI